MVVLLRSQSVLSLHSGYRVDVMVGINNDYIALMMGTEMVPETLDFNELTRLSAREEFINIPLFIASLSVKVYIQNTPNSVSR
jgi:hypothetical protein